MNLTKEQAKHLHKVLSYYGWKKGRELAGADLVNQQQVVAELNDFISRLDHPFPTYKDSK